MIIKLENTKKDVAQKIFKVFQRAYTVEAQLIGVADFPPLSRTVEDIEKSGSEFYAFMESESVAAVIEIEIDNQQLEINSLTVDPDHFRKGIAGKLIEYVLALGNVSQGIVETAALNLPAIGLYKKYGFVECKTWTPSHGIEKVAMSADIQGKSAQ